MRQRRFSPLYYRIGSYLLMFVCVTHTATAAEYLTRSFGFGAMDATIGGEVDDASEDTCIGQNHLSRSTHHGHIWPRNACRAETLSMPRTHCLRWDAIGSRVVLPETMPNGMSWFIAGCMLPCDATLAVTLTPHVTTGAQSANFTLEADYIDRWMVGRKCFGKHIPSTSCDR